MAFSFFRTKVYYVANSLLFEYVISDTWFTWYQEFNLIISYHYFVTHYLWVEDVLAFTANHFINLIIIQKVKLVSVLFFKEKVNA